jgi:hypothetical protein
MILHMHGRYFLTLLNDKAMNTSFLEKIKFKIKVTYRHIKIPNYIFYSLHLMTYTSYLLYDDHTVVEPKKDTVLCHTTVYRKVYHLCSVTIWMPASFAVVVSGLTESAVDLRFQPHI